MGEDMNRYSLRFKLIAYFFTLILIPLLVVSIFSYYASATIIERNVSESMNKSQLFIQKNMEDILVGVRSSVTPFLLNFQIREFLSQETNVSQYEHFTSLQYVMRELNSMKQSNFFISSISLYDLNDHRLVTSEEVIVEDYSGELERLSDIVAKLPEQQQWIFGKWPLTAYSTFDKYYITYPIPLRDDHGQLFSYLFIHVKQDTLTEYMRNLNRDASGFVTTILSAEGHSLVDINNGNDAFPFSLRVGEKLELEHADDIETSKSGSFVDHVNNQQVMVVFQTSDDTQFKYVTLVPFEAWTREMVSLRNGVIVVACLTALLALVVAIFFTRSIYHPMQLLLRHMRMLTEHEGLNEHIQVQRKDEFGILFQGFNTMVDNIKQLIKHLYHERLLKQDMELKLMQSRMHPHFLYNTLNSIHAIAKLHGIQEVSEMVYALAHFFRLSFKGDDFLTVKQMVEHLEFYLRIQKIRYKDKFQISFDIEDDIMDQSVFKFLLQPLVENAIIHGLELKETSGKITISGYKVQDNVVFTVSDDGLGITDEEIERIKQKLAGESNTTDDMFALMNTNQRIKNYYGDQYGIEIYSVLGKGTTVEVIIPFQHRGDHHV